MICLRQYLTNAVLGFLIGVNDSIASHVLSRVLPMLEAAGKDTMRIPGHGSKHRKEPDHCLPKHLT